MNQLIFLNYLATPTPPSLLPEGGFVDVGETVEDAVAREVKEETHLIVGGKGRTGAVIEQFRVYSDPSRDDRRHTVSVVCRCLVPAEKNAHDEIEEAKGSFLSFLKKGDDAKQVELIRLDKVLALDLAFDHRQVHNGCHVYGFHF